MERFSILTFSDYLDMQLLSPGMANHFEPDRQRLSDYETIMEKRLPFCFSEEEAARMHVWEEMIARRARI
jgi:hypothetical protein